MYSQPDKLWRVYILYCNHSNFISSLLLRFGSLRVIAGINPSKSIRSAGAKRLLEPKDSLSEAELGSLHSGRIEGAGTFVITVSGRYISLPPLQATTSSNHAS